MTDHVEQWLGAYLDGELGAVRRQQVLAHLATCPSCHQELESLQQLSALLRSVRIPESLPTGDAFTASLAPYLPERPPERIQTPRWTAPGLAWWLIPLVILGGWLVVQIALQLPVWIRVFVPLGLSNVALAWLAPDVFLSVWIDLVTRSLQPTLGRIIPLSLVDLAALGQVFLLQLGANAIAAILIMSWLAGLAARRIHLAHSPVPDSQTNLKRKVLNGSA